MLRVPLLCLAIFAAAWLEFTVFPGHSYLEGDTQIYLPILEKMDSPGLLSRDLVATTGNLSLTAYDEATLLLHEAGRQPLRRALLGQALLCRIAALAGVFLLARATGLGDLFAFVLAAIINLGASLAGPEIFLTDREPLPTAFAFSLLLLAMGLLTREYPLLAAVAAGIAFLYDPLLAAPFWCVSFLSFAFDPKMRTLVRPMLPVFLIFALLLANLAQLQPGTAAEPLFSRLSTSLSLFQRTYAPRLYVSEWPAGEIAQTLALFVLALWAGARCWLLLTSCFRWLVIGTATLGVLSIAASYLSLEQGHFAWAARTQPTRTLLFTLAAAALLFGLAGMRAILRRAIWEALAWFFLLFSLPAGRGVFDVRLFSFALAVVLAAILTLLLRLFADRPARFLTLAVPLIAVLAFARASVVHPQAIPTLASINDLAAWAEKSTWGSSIFLFPDAGHDTYPGVFRVQSRHGLWADWNSARGVAFSETAAARWQERWRDTMQAGFSAVRLEKMLPLPIDYYVLRTENQLEGARRSFANRDFVVYDAEDLRNTTKPLRMREH